MGAVNPVNVTGVCIFTHTHHKGVHDIHFFTRGCKWRLIQASNPWNAVLTRTYELWCARFSGQTLFSIKERKKTNLIIKPTEVTDGSRRYIRIRTKPYRIVEYSVLVAPCLRLLQQETECAEQCQDAHCAAVRAQLLPDCSFYNSSPPPQTSNT